MNNAVKWGLITGLGLVLLSLIFYLISPKAMFGWGQWVTYFVYIAGMAKSGLDERAARGGYMSWGEALKPTFLTYVVASLIAIVFFFLLITVIDPSLGDLQVDVAMEQTAKVMEALGQEMPDGMEEEMAAQAKLTLPKAALGYAIGLIFPGFILAALISLFVKKSNPDMA